MVLNLETQQRQGWMSLLAKAPADLLEQVWKAQKTQATFTWQRAPETGAVMVRGATGGTGAAFNLGEMTVTRCALRLECGAVGHAYIAGRDRKKAEIAALCDALLQTGAANKIEQNILTPLRKAQVQRRAHKSAKAAATKVDFFTLVRGDD